MELLLKGRRILVTGRRGALGRAVGQALEEESAQVIGLDRQGGQGCRAVDLLDEAAVEDVLGEILAEGPIDGACLLVGGYGRGSVGEISAAELDMLVGLNLRTAANVLRPLLPSMASRGYGRIVGVGAYAIRKSSAGQAAYNATKAALVSFMESAAEEVRLKGDVAVMTVLPTTLDTEANRRAMPDADSTRWVKLERIAALIAFLMSEPAGDLNGASIAVRARL